MKIFVKIGKDLWTQSFDNRSVHRHTDWQTEKNWFEGLCNALDRQISREPLNGFQRNSQGRSVCPSLGRVWMSRSKVKSQGHQGQKTAFLALSEACVRFMFGKIFLASSVFLSFSRLLWVRYQYPCNRLFGNTRLWNDWLCAYETLRSHVHSLTHFNRPVYQLHCDDAEATTLVGGEWTTDLNPQRFENTRPKRNVNTEAVDKNWLPVHLLPPAQVGRGYALTRVCLSVCLLAG